MIKSAETSFSFNFLMFSTSIFIVLITASLLLKNTTLTVLLYLLSLSLPFFYLLLYKLDMLVFIMVLAIPLSVKLTLGGGVVVSMPAEVMAGLIAVFYIVYRLLSPFRMNGRIFRHPITIFILIDISWLIVCTLFSEMPVISIKRIIVRGAFLIVFFFVFSVLFIELKNIARVWILYGIGLVVAVFSTLYNHSFYGFIKAVSFMMTKPFYNDHTLYATCIAYVMPVLGVVIAMPEKFGIKKKFRILIFLILCVLFTGEIFSFSRAAWLSIAVAILITLLVVFFRFRLIHFIFLTLISAGVVYHYWAYIYDYVEKVDAVSRSANTEEHMKSVMNIQTDVSNLERINRWQCALRMFRDRPLTGFGPGTYQFIYGKYQIKPEMTRISTLHGDKGNAHSEYLTYLSETGLPGFINFNLLILSAIYTAIKIFRKNRRKEVRWLAIAMLTGIITYFFHGLFNSFIDTDKASVLVYGSFAALVVMDIYHKDSNPENFLHSEKNIPD